MQGVAGEHGGVRDDRGLCEVLQHVGEQHPFNHLQEVAGKAEARPAIPVPQVHEGCARENEEKGERGTQRLDNRSLWNRYLATGKLDG